MMAKLYGTYFRKLNVKYDDVLRFIYHPPLVLMNCVKKGNIIIAKNAQPKWAGMVGAGPFVLL